MAFGAEGAVMKKDEVAMAPAWRHFPHLIVQGEARNRRLDLHVTNEPLPASRETWHAAYAFARAGAVNDEGRVTAIGRAAIVDGLRAEMHPNNEMCVVWGPRSCTYLTRHGTIDSDDPPHGQPEDVNAINRLHALDYEGIAVRLPAGCASTHLFVRRLAHDRVEIATAAAMPLHDRTEPLRPGEVDPLEGCTDRRGRFTPPRRLMGVDVAGDDGGMLLGPVQPDGAAFAVVPAWPSRVAEACLELAGRPLTVEVVQAAWRAAEELSYPPIRCGVRHAA